MASRQVIFWALGLALIGVRIAGLAQPAPFAASRTGILAPESASAQAAAAMQPSIPSRPSMLPGVGPNPGAEAEEPAPVRGRPRYSQSPALLRQRLRARVRRPPVFRDVGHAAGLDYVQYLVTPHPLVGEAEYMSGGGAAGDFDSDGWTDVFVTRLDAPGILFRNRGDGTFEDVTAEAGLEMPRTSTNGPAWADIDNDGDQDLVVTTLGTDQHRHYLFINDGTGHFTEEAVARDAALAGPDPHYGFSASFGDYDRDGWLDLYVTEWRPSFYNPAATPSNSRLLHNRGAQAPGYFEDVTEAAGVSIDGIPTTDPKASGTFSFASHFLDVDVDGWPDLLIAGDYGTSRLYWNDRDGTFTDGTVDAGVGSEENGMGSTVGDYDGDGLPDWFVTSILDPEGRCSNPNYACHWGTSGNRLYHNDGSRRFSDQTDAAGVRDGYWGWGAAFFDYDNDGDLDLAQTNGIDFPFASDPTNILGRFRADPMRLWRNDNARMSEVSAASGVVDTGLGKGLMTLDYDKDGDLDLFVVNNAGPPVLYRNDGGNRLGYLRVKLVGHASNRDGIGARVYVSANAGGPVQSREISPYLFLGQSEPIAHFGLGPGTTPVSEVRVVWPRGGGDQVLRGVARNQTLIVHESIPDTAQSATAIEAARP